MILFRSKFFSRFEPFREEYLEAKREENIKLALSRDKKEIERVKAMIKNDWNDYKSYLKKTYVSYDNFETITLNNYLSGDPITVLKYIKSERKQGIDEEAQFKYIDSEFSEVVGKNNIQRVKKSDNMYFVNNKIVYASKDDIRKKYKSLAKSIDLKINYPLFGKTFTGIGTLKHTTGEGGSQDNQFTDIENTNIEFVKSTDKNLYTFTIVSGSHYKDSRFKYLINTYKTDRNKIVSVDKFGYILIKCILDWISKTINPAILSEDQIIQLNNEISRLTALSIKYRLNMSTL
jgi:hypothetical protein